MPARPDHPETSPRPARGTLVAVGLCLGALALAGGGCGRRGSLEPPNGAVRQSSALTASPRSLPEGVGVAAGTPAPDSEAVRDGDELPVSATPAGVDSAPVVTNRGAKKGYVIPKGPFFLDPIL